MYTDFYLFICIIWQSGIADLSLKIYTKIPIIHEQIPVIKVKKNILNLVI